MLKPISLGAIAVAAIAWALLAARPHEAAAEASSAYVNLVELDIAPAEFDKYMDAIKENGAAAVKEPGCRAFNISISQNDPHHVVLFEVYDSAAALEAHRATDHFKKYQATVANMVTKRDVRPLSLVAMNLK